MRTLLVCLAILALGATAMAAGQAVGLKHPVLDHKLDPAQVQSLQGAAAPLLTMSDEQMLAFIPPHGYVNYCECPNCYGGVEGNGVLTWSFDRPNELKCRFCNTVVLPNPKYPEDKTLTGQNMLGEPVTYKYYYNEERKVAHFMSGHRWMYKRAWLIARVTECAKLYALTGRPDYARRVAVVLDGFAEAYRHYPVMQNGPRRYAFREQKLHWPWDSGRWNFFHNEIPVEILPAYDLTYDSPVYDELSTQRGYEVREKIERDFIKAAAEGAIARQDEVSNVSGYDIRSAALAGRIINDPPLVHWAYAEMIKHVDEGFYRDGMWKEGTPSYHAMTVGGLRYSFEAVRGYSDPPGYKDPASGRRLDNVQPEQDLPAWARCQTAGQVMDMPNGMSSCIHDTHPYERRSKPREVSVCTILPGLGHVSLGRGRGSDQILAQLHFSGGYGHQHCDNLNLMLWAKERELLPDLGYTWTQMRYWTSSSLGHNLVVVNRQDQETYRSDGNLLLYVPGDPAHPDGLSLAVVEASQERGYQKIKGLDLYRRLLVLVPVSAQDAYVADLFRVRGGNTHDWTLNGDADRDSVAACSVPLSGSRRWLLEEGEEWKEPTLEGERHHAYGMVRDAQSGPCGGELELRMTGVGDPGRGLRTWLRTGPCEALLGRSPSVRRMGQGTQGDMRKAYDFWMPKFIARRTGSEPLTSLFAAVHEPFGGETFIRSVKRLKLTPDDGLAAALQVEHSGGTDTIISAAPGCEDTEYRADTGVSLKGRLGVVRVNAGKLVGAWLIEGTSLCGANWQITTATPAFTGDLVEVRRVADGAKEDAFVTTAALPEGTVLAGRWLIATYQDDVTQGYEIKSVRREGDRSLIALTADPEIRFTGAGAQELCHPRRKFDGPRTFRLAGVAALYAQPGGTYRTELTAPAEFSLPK